MATREENIKKINDELEMMSDEELDQVAGGGWQWLRKAEINAGKMSDAQQNQNNVQRSWESIKMSDA